MQKKEKGINQVIDDLSKKLEKMEKAKGIIKLGAKEDLEKFVHDVYQNTKVDLIRSENIEPRLVANTRFGEVVKKFNFINEFHQFMILKLCSLEMHSLNCDKFAFISQATMRKNPLHKILDSDTQDKGKEILIIAGANNAGDRIIITATIKRNGVLSLVDESKLSDPESNDEGLLNFLCEGIFNKKFEKEK